MCCSAHLPHPSKSIKAQLRPQKKRERSETGNDFTNPQIAAIRNQSLIVWTVPSTSYGSDSLPGMKTPTTTPESPQRSEETHIEASAVGNLLPRKQMGKHDRLIEMDLRWIATEIPLLRKNDFQSEITLLENKTCLPLKTNDKAGRLPFFFQSNVLYPRMFKSSKAKCLIIGGIKVPYHLKCSCCRCQVTSFAILMSMYPLVEVQSVQSVACHQSWENVIDLVILEDMFANLFSILVITLLKDIKYLRHKMTIINSQRRCQFAGHKFLKTRRITATMLVALPSKLTDQSLHGRTGPHKRGHRIVKDAATVASKPGGICHLLQAVPPVVSIVDGEFSTETWLNKHCEDFPTGEGTLELIITRTPHSS